VVNIHQRNQYWFTKGKSGMSCDEPRLFSVNYTLFLRKLICGMKSFLKNHLPITIISVLFFVFGAITWVNGTLITYLQVACELTNFQALLVTFAFYISYTLTALPSAFVLQKIGFKKGMSVGLFVMAMGCFLFIPAALKRQYILFLSGLFVVGTGLSLLQTATNPYVTILGPKETAAKRISIMGICNKLAGCIAPIVLSQFLLSNGTDFFKEIESLNEVDKVIALDALAARVIDPYVCVSIALAVLGTVLLFVPLPEVELENDDDCLEKGLDERKSILHYPHLILGAIALFFYVGVEVIAADTIIKYGVSLDIDMSISKNFTSLTLGTMILGYVLGILLMPKYISQQRVLVISAVIGLVFSVLTLVLDGFCSIASVAFLGLANAMIWPTIWPLSICGLGKFIKQGSALLIMSIAGGAVLPLVWGNIADVASPQVAYSVLIPSYLFILYFSLRGYNKKSW